MLHGGSGVEPHALRDCVRAGVRKLNVSTEIHTAFAQAVAGITGSDPRPALRQARHAGATPAPLRIDALGSALRG